MKQSLSRRSVIYVFTKLSYAVFALSISCTSTLSPRYASSIAIFSAAVLSAVIAVADAANSSASSSGVLRVLYPTTAAFSVSESMPYTSLIFCFNSAFAVSSVNALYFSINPLTYSGVAYVTDVIIISIA